MKLFSKKQKPTKVMEADPFVIEIHEKKDISKCKVIVTIANNGVKYEFNPSSEAYWFITSAVDTQATDSMKSFLTILTLTSNMLCNDSDFLADIVKIINKATERKQRKGAEAAKEVTKDDEDLSQEFMEGVAEKIDEKEKEQEKPKPKKRTVSGKGKNSKKK